MAPSDSLAILLRFLGRKLQGRSRRRSRRRLRRTSWSLRNFKSEGLARPKALKKIQVTEEILQVFLSYSLLVLESVDTQIYVHVHDHVRSYRADNESIWGSF